MSVSKLDISEKLIEGYAKVLPSLKEQTITNLAIHLCQNVELNKIFLFETGLIKGHCTYWFDWDISNTAGSTYMCQKLPLPSELKHLLIVRMRTIILQMHDWTSQQDIFKISPLFTDNFLSPSDWVVVEMRLDKKKISKRLVQDERIPLVQRYRMACFHCLEFFIHSLWNEMSRELREGSLHRNKNTIVYMWSKENVSGKLISTPSEGTFWLRLLKRGVFERSIASVLQSWAKLNISIRQEVLIDTALEAVTKVYESLHSSSKGQSTDILCFLLMNMSKEQRISFFQIAFQDNIHCVLVCFLRWPYMDLLPAIINELWTILPESEYLSLLLALARRYSDAYPYILERKEYMDYDYGYLIVELLQLTPDHFKRYVFSSNYPSDANSIANDKILYTILRKGAHKIQYRKVLKNTWQHVTFEERRSFLRSYDGKKLCCNFAEQGKRKLLISILKEDLPKDEILIFKKKVLDMN